MEEKLVIELKDAQVFQGHNLILSDVDVQIRKGEFWYLIGQTGSGKSSMLTTWSGELLLENGYARIADMDLSTLKQTD
ncbi:MAG: ATP-binding cassette domain-containing protein, partial [Bacteroidota bacterium]